jgi:hypothetical protein
MNTHGDDLQNLEAELLHWEQLYASEESMADLVSAAERSVLNNIGPKVEEARRRFETLSHATDADYSERRGDLKELFKDIRDSFKRLDRKHSDWVPLS